MLGEPIGIYKSEENHKAESTTTVKQSGSAVRAGTVVVLETVTVADYTTSNKKLLLGRLDGSGREHYVHIEQYTGIFETHLRGKMVLLPGEKPLGIVESPTAADVLYFSAYGLVYKLP